ncbi:hypothetical protein O181_026891 [Austropuccinia psidii MF-1]|uniref:Reverse transcriptase Ty1/copia-type domain-containing protein n=1 Tax=Austropuccinia psidii MF-1 TaxID=1389203 RepID=A0A9Q3CRD2_9BASI|nr:hypothetical protein [Austropuccinia psidii MF-1]
MIGSDILISTEAEGPLLRATYCGNGWKWQLPLFSRLLAREIDSNDIKLTHSEGNMPRESMCPHFCYATLTNTEATWGLGARLPQIEQPRNSRLQTLPASKEPASFTFEIKSQIGTSGAEHLTITPKMYKQAITSPDREEWLKAINWELGNMDDHSVFEILPLPDGMKPIGGGWVSVQKQPNGAEPPCLKAQYVMGGNSQLRGQDFHETFAPTATFTSLRILLTIAA